MASIASNAMQSRKETCIGSPEGSRLLDRCLGARSPQPKHALIHVNLVHGKALFERDPFRQLPHVAALRVLSDEVSALLHLAHGDYSSQLGQRDRYFSASPPRSRVDAAIECGEALHSRARGADEKHHRLRNGDVVKEPFYRGLLLEVVARDDVEVRAFLIPTPDEQGARVAGSSAKLSNIIICKR